MIEDSFYSWLSERKTDVNEPRDILPSGSVVGECRICALLGQGGFADVYRATVGNGEVVAVKILHRLDDKSRARFVRESEILSRIKHPHFPRLLCSGSVGERPYIVLEFLRGCDLPSTDREIASFLKQIISAVEELHRHGYIHRDIKPANILFRADGTPVLIDFGLASPMCAIRHEKEGLSVDGGKNVAVGTVGYSAPEQFSGQAAGPEADVHAIGVLIDECYRGKMPGCWRRIYLAATASNPKSRYSTVVELRKAINVRHLRKAFFSILGVTLLVLLAFLLMEGAKRYSIENGTPRKFQESEV